jgi:hypothetical protein
MRYNHLSIRFSGHNEASRHPSFFHWLAAFVRRVFSGNCPVLRCSAHTQVHLVPPACDIDEDKRLAQAEDAFRLFQRVAGLPDRGEMLADETFQEQEMANNDSRDDSRPSGPGRLPAADPADWSGPLSTSG